ncbi:MAG: hypothetical protein A2W80_04575 [Candidatus Riflebacteria bacterium GWC2_50_8]|nr:MAG: hypothetical protein A2W80_04575 [Candidatus Riflebacteria bacterium GWC2_50_8]
MVTAEKTAKSWWLYIVECADNSLYTGITNDIERRMAKHNEGTASRYTRARTPVKLVYREPHPDRSSASRRELEVKRLARDEKLALISAGARRAKRKYSPRETDKATP